MSTGYVRNDTTNNISNGNIVDASDLDGEFDAIQAAFDATTGHDHDGTVGGGSPILTLGPAQDVVVTTSVVRPKTDNTVDLGTSTLEFKDLYIDGVANIDSLVADTADINAGTIDGTTIGGASAAVGTFTTANATTVDTTNLEVTTLKAKDGTAAGSIADTTGIVTLASSVLTTTDINGGTIDSTSIGATTASTVRGTTITATTGFSGDVTGSVTVDAGKTLDVSAGTLTLADNQISGDKVEGGTINATTITTLTSTTVNATTVDTTNLEVTNLKAKDGTAAGSIANTGVVTLVSSVLTTTDINGGTIDGTVIGGTTPAAITGTTVTATGDLTIPDKIVHAGDTDTSLRFPAADTVTVETAGVERLRIAADGLVGIGRTNPTTKLDVAGTVSALSGAPDAPAFTFSTDPDTGMYRTGSNRLSFATAGAESLQLFGTIASFPVATGDGSVVLGSGRSGNGNVHYNLVGDTTYTDFGMRLARASGANGDTTLTHRGTGDLTLTTNEAAGIAFRTTNTEQARIDASGRFLVGRTSYGGADTVPGLQVTPEGHIFMTSASNSVFNRITSDGAVVQFRRQATTVGSISVTGSATTYATSSDYRLKENVVPVANAADRVLLLKPRNFNFISDPTNPVDGFLAHEAQAIVPNSVTGQKDEVDADGVPVHQSIDHSKMVPLLTAALQEALAKITALEARVTALEA